MATRQKTDKPAGAVHRPQTNGRASPSASRRRKLQAIQSAAHEYCLLHYAVGFSGGTPRRLCLHGNDVWVVPIVFNSPDIGPVGEVGVLAIDAHTHGVIDATPRTEVRAAAAHLAQEQRDAIDAAFHRARNAR